jgi:ribonuclease BN (tRNA processing enzyme)
MKITILGSGTCVPSLERSSCSILVETEKSKILFDCGAGTIRRLLEAGIAIFEITHIFFSHLHPDHTGEFVSFLFSTKYPPDLRQRQPFTVVAARGFVDFYEGLRNVYGAWIEVSDIMNLVELDNRGLDHFSSDDFTVESLPMNHTPQSLGYRIMSHKDSRSVVYSGDTDYSENLIELSQGTDLLISECALPDEIKVQGHLTPSLAGGIAQKAGVKRLLLTHFYPQCDSVDIISQCRKTYDGEIIPAHDLMTISF